MSTNTQNNYNINQEQNFIEFNNLEGYYIKISFWQSITITVYNLDSLDTKRYESQITVSSLFKINEIFKELRTPKEIYNYIIKLIKENNYKIEPENEGLLLTLFIPEKYITSEAKIFLANYDRKCGS